MQDIENIIDELLLGNPEYKEDIGIMVLVGLKLEEMGHTSLESKLRKLLKT